MESRPPTKRLREALYQPLEGLPERKRAHSRLGKATRWLVNSVFGRGIDTSEFAVELDHFHRDRVWYVPSDWFDLRRALRDVEIGPEDVFVDFGSGKGRIVHQAARYPFGRVIGIEISERLNGIARDNIEKKRHRFRCQSIDLVTIDAVEFPVPDEMTVAYFFHPFGGETFRTVIQNIVRSIEQHPRRVTIIYQIPSEEDYLLSTGLFHLVRTAKLKADDPHRIAIYESSLPGSRAVNTGRGFPSASHGQPPR